jgi:D-tyrosyl-tRNA(Tyr) deacylase
VIALIQRVDEARVDVEGETVGAIAVGLLALIGVQPGDDASAPGRLLDCLLHYRIFPDAAGRMNRSLRDVGGGLLLVPQFTLAADTHSGLRPSFSTAASPTLGRERFDTLVEIALATHAPVAAGRFGADMRVQLVNNGPVTFWLEV